jgi:hypothetical protein
MVRGIIVTAGVKFGALARIASNSLTPGSVIAPKRLWGLDIWKVALGKLRGFLWPKGEKSKYSPFTDLSTKLWVELRQEVSLSLD